MKKLLLAALLVAGISSFSTEITGPKYRVEAGLGTSVFLVDEHLSVLPEWKAQINPSFDITFGPKFSIEASEFVGHKILGSLVENEDVKKMEATAIVGNVGFETDFNIKLPNTENKFYVGLEVGAGVGAAIAKVKEQTIVAPTFNGISKITLGGKIKNKGNVGVYLGIGKGIIGLEGGYTF